MPILGWEVNMKETGIVRRIDELGRVVIPKELRKVLKFKEGELLEIFTNDNGELVFKKYNEVGATQEQIEAISKVLYKNTGKEVAICDTTSILAHAGGSEALQGEEISEELYGVLVETYKRTRRAPCRRRRKKEQRRAIYSAFDKQRRPIRRNNSFGGQVGRGGHGSLRRYGWIFDLQHRLI